MRSKFHPHYHYSETFGYKSHHPEFETWKTMKRRCSNPKSKDYKTYGAKGINYDLSWENFFNFLTDMGPRPSISHSLDRIDNSKGYSKENCRWATPQEQSENRRIKHECFKGHPWTKESTIVTHNGVKTTRRCRICYEDRIKKQRLSNDQHPKRTTAED